MIQTKFDRWLIETFIYEYDILVLQPPKRKIRGSKMEEIPYSPNSPYKYKIRCKSKKKTDRIIEEYREAGQTFKTEIIERKRLFGGLINNKRKSFTFRVFWWIVTISLICTGLISFYKFSQTEFYAEIVQDIKTLLKASK